MDHVPALTDRSEEEAALAQGARSGSTVALGELYTRYAETVYRLAYRVTASVQDAEDVLQDVFLGLPRALAKFDEQRRLEPWLKSVAARTALMRIRSGKRRREEAMDALREPPTSAAEPVIDRLEVQKALRSMPEGLRIVFLLKEVEGYSHAEVAELLDISSGASAARLSRAWAFLRKEVGDP